jgi:hypothetical protein
MLTKIAAAALICGFCFVAAPIARPQEKPIRFEIGPLFTYLRVPDSIPINAQNQAEIGGRFSWNFSRLVALDTELEGSPFRTTNLTTSYQGGYLLQSFVGIKAGKRWGKFGIFGKFRPGLTSYSGVIKQFQSGTLGFGRRTDPAFDLGGIAEFYVLRRILLRYDFGDTIIHYNSSTITISGQSIAAPSELRNNFKFLTAIAFRF